MNLDNERKAFEDLAKKETCWDLYWSENIDQYMDHQTNGAWLSWQASANRQGYKLVPVEPTQGMVDKAVCDTPETPSQDYWHDSQPISDDQAIACYKAMIGEETK